MSSASTPATGCTVTAKPGPLDRYISEAMGSPTQRERPADVASDGGLTADIESFLAHLATFRSRRTLHSYREELDVVARDAGALGLPGDIARWTEPDVLALRARWDGLAPTSLNKRLIVLAGLLAFHGNEVVAEMKARGRLLLPLPRRRSVRHVGAGERHLLFAAATPMERAVLALGFSLGLRLSELAALRLDDLRVGELVVRRGGRGWALPLAEPVEREVRAYAEGPRAATVAFARARGCEDPDPGTLLVHYTRHLLAPYQEDSLGNLLMDLGARAGVAFSAHDMRRTCATELAERDVAIEVIQDAMGHENLESTRKYVQVRQGRLHAAMDGYQGAVCGETGNGDGHGNP